MKEIIDEMTKWQYLQKLPVRCAGFDLAIEQIEQSGQYILFSYRKSDAHRSFTVLYDSLTKDFLARVVIGLVVYYDLHFIAADFSALEQVLEERLEKALAKLAAPEPKDYESTFKSKGILDWHYADSLPSEIAGFQLFISPKQPAKVLNGSYIIIDYSDFGAASNLAVYYNVYRDEFFAEARFNHAPRMLNVFDTRELQKLADKIESNLTFVLQNLRCEIDCQAGKEGHIE